MRLQSKSMLLPFDQSKSNSTLIGATSFSDDEIIRVYDMLLTPGTHHWKMPNVMMGRTILWSFLKALGYHQDIGCITIHPQALPLSVLSLIEYWKVAGYLASDRKYELSSFFAHDCTNDFVWIEYNEALQEASWLAEVEYELNAWHLETYMTIVYVTYD